MLVLSHLPPDRRVHCHLAQHGFQLLQGDTARPQQPRGRNGQIHNGGFHPHRAWAAVHDSVDFSVHILQHIGRAGRAGAAGGVARGGGHRHSGGRDDGPCDHMVRAAHSYRIQPGGHPVRDGGLALQNHGQRAGPEASRQGIGHARDVRAVTLQPIRRGDVEDQRIILRAAFCRKNTRDRLRVQAVGPQAVHRLGGNAQQAAPAQDRRALRHLVGPEFLCFHAHSPHNPSLSGARGGLGRPAPE